MDKDRRDFILRASCAAALSGWRGASAAAPPAGGPRLAQGAPQPYAYEDLVERARAAAGRPYRAPRVLAPEVLERIDYDAHGRIRFKPEAALFADGPGRFPVTFFHLGRYFRTPVKMFVVEGGSARELLYDPSLFDMPADSPARALPLDSGFAGFRVQESRLGGAEAPDWQRNDWVAFLGASYFRAIGELYQYGLSARGVAVNVAVAGRAEEFPAFTHFYFETAGGDADRLTVTALLDGPSVAGAYRFILQRDRAVLIDVECALFVRSAIERLGLAPLTSMYWFSETVKPTAVDWRPEVHDSDGLAIWNGGGEHIWRPLTDPPAVAASAFVDRDPRGYGLLQRDRNFDHYLDGVYYDRRPSLWVEPLEPWGEGAVQLVEIPTDDEINDNIVAMWVPKAPAAAGAALRLRYRLHWRADEPFPTPLARCVATRLGRGGQPGHPRPAGVTKFAVEFLGGPLAELPFGVKPEAVLDATRGRFLRVQTEAVPDGVAGHWRAFFDFELEGQATADLRLFLRSGERTLSETWLYPFRPA
jgi:glucans biosynthesis protein